MDPALPATQRDETLEEHEPRSMTPPQTSFEEEPRHVDANSTQGLAPSKKSRSQRARRFSEKLLQQRERHQKDKEPHQQMGKQKRHPHQQQQEHFMPEALEAQQQRERRRIVGVKTLPTKMRWRNNGRVNEKTRLLCDSTDADTINNNKNHNNNNNNSNSRDVADHLNDYFLRVSSMTDNHSGDSFETQPTRGSSSSPEIYASQKGQSRDDSRKRERRRMNGRRDDVDETRCGRRAEMTDEKGEETRHEAGDRRYRTLPGYKNTRCIEDGRKDVREEEERKDVNKTGQNEDYLKEMDEFLIKRIKGDDDYEVPPIATALRERGDVWMTPSPSRKQKNEQQQQPHEEQKQRTLRDNIEDN